MDSVPSRRTELYPPLEPYADGLLDLDAGHWMYWEASGNPHGVPVLFLHGGPGGGCSPEHRRFFDPAVFRIVLFDQRGAGRSRPHAVVAGNTTAALVADIERLRLHLGIDRWLLFGGSWGSTLALAYGQRHPACCLGFVLRGIFLGGASEIDWFLHGMANFFPAAHRRFVEMLPPGERGDPLRGYLQRLFDPDPRVHLPFACAWSEYEGNCSTLLPNADVVRQAPDEALALARIEAHYFAHGCFLAPGELLDGVERIAHLPATIVQARYDVVCPPVSAEALARAWPGARHVVVPDAGHSVWEPPVRAAVLRAVEEMKLRLALR